MKIFFDGGCRPNPGVIEVAAVAAGRLHHLADAGYGHSDEAEWLALLHALDVAGSLRVLDVVLIGDAADVISQASGRSKCRSAKAQEYRARFLSRRGAFARVRIRHARRGQNLAGIALQRMRANAPI